MSDDFIAEDPPWGGEWPAAGIAIDVPSPAPGPHWKVLRGWLTDFGFEVDPNLHAELGLVGYSLRVRNAMIGVGIVKRPFGLHLAVTAVLCRGMEREAVAMAALDQANASLRMGQLLYYPGPPAELAFYASTPWNLLNTEVFPAFLSAIFREVEETCFAAVAAVRGFHPADMTQFWEQLEAMVDDAVRKQGQGSDEQGEAGSGEAADSAADTVAPPKALAAPKRNLPALIKQRAVKVRKAKKASEGSGTES